MRLVLIAILLVWSSLTHAQDQWQLAPKQSNEAGQSFCETISSSGLGIRFFDERHYLIAFLNVDAASNAALKKLETNGQTRAVVQADSLYGYFTTLTLEVSASKNRLSFVGDDYHLIDAMKRAKKLNIVVTDDPGRIFDLKLDDVDFSVALSGSRKALDRLSKCIDPDQFGLDRAAKAVEREDFVTAYKLTKPLAEKGNAEAQYRLGATYKYGKGVEQDYKKSFQWMMRAAKQGHARAQHDVGIMYDRGKGVERNIRAAVIWNSRSALNGSALAQYTLAERYRVGDGVDANLVKSYTWYKIASGDTGTGNVFIDNGEVGEKAKRTLKQISNSLSKAQIDKADRMLKACMAEEDMQKALVACGIETARSDTESGEVTTEAEITAKSGVRFFKPKWGPPIGKDDATSLQLSSEPIAPSNHESKPTDDAPKLNWVEVSPSLWPAETAEAEGIEFLFDGNSVRVIGDPTKRLTIGEEISIPELIARFQSGPLFYKVILSSECEGDCAIIEGKLGSITVYFDEFRVNGINSWGSGSIDVRGNRPGTSLVNANKTSKLRCAYDEHGTCSSALIDGLHYIIGMDSNCDFEVSTTGITDVPSCAEVEGFELWGQSTWLRPIDSKDANVSSVEPSSENGVAQNQENLKSVTFLRGKCRFQLIAGFFPCEDTVMWGELKTGGAFLTFIRDETMFSLAGHSDRQPNLENYYLQISRARLYKNGELEAEDTGMEGECHFRLNKNASKFYFLRCDIYNRAKGSIYNFYLDPITGFERH